MPRLILLTGEAFLVIGLFAAGSQFVLGGIGRIVGFHAASKAGALHALRPQVIERFDALFPCLEVQHHQVPFVDIGGDEEIQRLRLIDEGRTVGGEFEQPALIDLEAGLVGRLLFRAQEVEMLNRSALFEDRIPHILDRAMT